MSYGNPRFAYNAAGNLTVTTNPVEVVITVPGAVTAVYSPITSLTMEGILANNLDILEAVSRVVVGDPTVVPVIIPGQEIEVDTGGSTGTDTGTNTGTDTPVGGGTAGPIIPVVDSDTPTGVIVPSPVVLPPEIAGRNPYFGKGAIIGQTATTVTWAESVGYYLSGAVPDYLNDLPCIQWVKYFEYTAGASAFTFLGSNFVDINLAGSIITCNRQGVGNRYVFADRTRNKVYYGADGVMAQKAPALPSPDKCMVLGCSDSQFVIITSPNNRVYTSSTGETWTDKGIAAGLPTNYMSRDSSGRPVPEADAQSIGRKGILWVLRGSNFYYSLDADATTWAEATPITVSNLPTPVGLAVPIQILDLAYNGSIYAAVMVYGSIYSRTVQIIATSSNAVDWEWRYGEPDNAGINLGDNIYAVGTEFVCSSFKGSSRYHISSGGGTVWPNPVPAFTSGASSSYAVVGDSVLTTSSATGINPNPWPRPSNFIDSSLRYIANLNSLPQLVNLPYA